MLGDDRMPDNIKSAVQREQVIYVSAASIWEMRIKQSKGKITLPDDLIQRISDAGFRELRVSFHHAEMAGKLPLIHRDPFDRMLIAQAKCEDLTFVTVDRECQSYDVPLLAEATRSDYATRESSGQAGSATEA